MQTQTINQTYELPAEAAKFLRSLESRNLSLSIQKKKSEVGDWRDEFQIRGGAIFGADWEKLNRFRRHFVRYCEERNLVDDSFSEIETPKYLFANTKTVLSSDEKRVRAAHSDEKAIANKKQVKQMSDEERAEKNRNQREWRAARFQPKPRADFWLESQLNFIAEVCDDLSKWPHTQTGYSRDKNKLKVENIMAEVNRLGRKRTWLAIQTQAKKIRRDRKNRVSS